jgi:hypothetical protein
MKKLIALYVFCTTFAFGQAYPRPYISGGVSLMPPGYASVAGAVGAGVQFNRPYFVFDSFAGYDNGHKTNDNDNAPNSKGHDRYLRGFAGYKRGAYFAGVGARWTDLSTPDYTDFSWHPEAGVGRDWGKDFRLLAAYEFPPAKPVTRYPNGTTCYGCSSGLHGADLQFWIPAPTNRSHFFAKMDLTIFRYHSTDTDPSNVTLTQQENASKSFGAGVEFSLGARF